MSLRSLASISLRRPVLSTRHTSTAPHLPTPLNSSSVRSFASSYLSSSPSPHSDASKLLSPAVMFLVRSERIDPASVKGTGKDGRLLKFDVVQAIRAGTAKKLSPSAASSASSASAPSPPPMKRQEGPRFTTGGRRNRSLMFEPLPSPPPRAAAPAKAAAAAQSSVVQAIDKAQPAASTPPKAAKPQPAPLRRQEGPRYTADGRRNRSAMFESP